jgi:hypothetical protein
MDLVGTQLKTSYLCSAAWNPLPTEIPPAVPCRSAHYLQCILQSVLMHFRPCAPLYDSLGVHCDEQAPRNGGPFVLSHEKLPQIVASLNSVAKACKLVANLCIGLGTVLITIKAIQGTRKYFRQRRFR